MTKPTHSRPVVLAITSDWHCGSTVALCPPSIALDDGGSYQASKPQHWLWDRWQAYWQRVATVRDDLGASLYMLGNGDAVDGDHHKTTQILSGNPAAQAAVVDATLKLPLSLKPDHIVLVRGTEAHVGSSASSEERIARGLRKDGWPVIGDDVTGTASLWHWRATIQGVRLDFAHHGRVGTRPWTKPNVVANLAAEIFYDHAREDMKRNQMPTAPHLAVRSHMHQYVDTHDQHPTRVIQTPAWQLATAFIHRIAPGKIADVGGLIVTIQDGAFDVEPVIYHPEASPVWQAA